MKIDDLDKVPGIGSKTSERIKEEFQEKCVESEKEANTFHIQIPRIWDFRIVYGRLLIILFERTLYNTKKEQRGGTDGKHDEN